MTVLFSAVYIVYFCWFLNRRFDLFSLTFLTSMVYFLPAVFGFTHDGTLPIFRNPIGAGQYWFYFFYFTTLFVMAWVFSRTQTAIVLAPAAPADGTLIMRDLKTLATMTRLLRLAVPVLLGLAWVSMGANLFADEKQAVLDNFSIFYSFYQATTLIYLLSSHLAKKNRDFIFCCSFLVFDMVVGFRAITAFGLICLCTLALLQKSSRKRFLLFSMILLTAYVFASIYKTAVQAYRMGTPSELVSLLEVSTLLDALMLTESFVQQEVFSAVIASRLTLPPEYPLELFRAFLPGINNLLLGKGLGFNDYYQGKLFPHIPWGIGSNVWAEQYAMWNWPGPIMYVIFLFSLLFYLNKKALKWLSTGEILKLSLLVYLAVPFYFYMHRNDLAFQIVTTRNFLVIWLIVFGLSKYVFPRLRFRDQPLP